MCPLEGMGEGRRGEEGGGVGEGGRGSVVNHKKWIACWRVDETRSVGCV